MIREAGFDGVSIWWGDDYGGYGFREAPILARKAGLYIENVHVPFEPMNHLWEDTLDGGALAEKLLSFVDDCAEHEIPTIVMHASYGEAPPINKIGLQRFECLIEQAEQKNVKIALENMRRESQLLQASELLEHFDVPSLGFCFDSGHHNIRLSLTPECDLLSRFGHRLMAIHLHDNSGTIATQNDVDQHLLPFDGTIDWNKTMKDIKNTGYNGAIALEVCNVGYEKLSAPEFLQEAFNRAKKLETLG